MTQRYYFNLSDGRRWYPDPMGVELDSPDRARQRAFQDAQALLESWMARSALPWRLVVHDSSGTVLCSLNLVEIAASSAHLIVSDGAERTKSVEPSPPRTSRIFVPQHSPRTNAHTTRPAYRSLRVAPGVTELQHRAHNDK
ncbi:DUF6894 family protein [Microvirga makkahensis]|uniref:DUF6894 family protein n=1 Tax=Microvirga makkahensis TaxID=1128670 RepID=UPI003CCCD9C2